MKTINIKGKNYVPVVERLKEFRSSENFKNWSLETEWLSITQEVATCRVIIRDENGVLKSTGTAMELRDEKSSLVNKTSHVENAETSAVGRALGNLGIGLDGDEVASYEEVSRAKKQQLISSINSMVDERNREEYEREYKLSEIGMMSIEDLEVLENQLKINQKTLLCEAITNIATTEDMEGILKKYKTKNLGSLDLKDLQTTHDILVKFNQKCSQKELEDLSVLCKFVDIDMANYIKEHYKKEAKELTKREYSQMKKKLNSKEQINGEIRIHKANAKTYILAFR